jgi:CRP-like cAMP-binding protein
MTNDDALSLTGHQSPHWYEKGTTIFRQGDAAAAFYAVISGWVKLYRTTPDGLEVVLHVFKTGETFAEAAMFLGGEYPASAQAVSKARLVRIDGAVFRACIHERPELAFSMLASASHHLKFLVEQVEQMKVRSAPQRIAEFILGLTAGSNSGPAEIEFPFEKNLLANRLGMKPESFSRALAKLRSCGVTVEKEIIRIEDLGCLRRFVDYGEDGGQD